MKFYLIIAFIAVGILVSCQKPLKSGIDISHMNKTVKPQNNLYEYMNGNYLKALKIPEDKARYGSFDMIYEEAQKNLRGIIEEAAQAKANKAGSNPQKVGDMYMSFMDSSRVEELGMKPIVAELEKIASIKNQKDLANYMGYATIYNIQTPFGAYVDQDAKNPTSYIVYVTQSGLSLPDRSYYFSDTERMKQIREAFSKHLENIFNLAQIKNAAQKAKTVVMIETQIARRHWERAANRDRNKTYNKYTRGQLTKLMPDFDWGTYLDAAEASKVENVIVRQPDYFQALNTIIKKVSVEDWKTYYTYKLLKSRAAYLSSNFVNENFSFYGKTLSGVQKNRPRWKRGVSVTQRALGEVIGKIYVSKYFKPEAKERMVELVGNLKAAFKERIKQLDWMSDATKKKALEKLSKINTKIGYPDKWKDYSALSITKDDLMGNVNNSKLVEHRREIAKLGNPVDRGEWFMYPQTVNAYYNASMNEVVFPAAILQPPFFNMEADDAVNYGGIGAVIGHELTHGFDDQGRKSDGDGKLTEWWTKEDAEKFDARAAKMVAEYDAFSPIDTLHLNGKLTLGENIADLGGCTISYYAYHHALAGNEAPVIDGFTGDQRFFLGWAQVWASKSRPDEIRRRIKTDPHSPTEYRSNGITSNMEEFYKAFDVKDGDAMMRPADKRVKIW